MPEKLFDNPDFDPERFETEMKKAPARRRYAIYFTPRSGSSWLTDTLTDSKCLGKPQEFFNPNFIPRIARSLNANSLEAISNCCCAGKSWWNISRLRNHDLSMHRVFGIGRKVSRILSAHLPAFYLRREDMVLQAVSLAKAVKTSVFHSKNTQSPSDQSGG